MTKTEFDVHVCCEDCGEDVGSTFECTKCNRWSDIEFEDENKNGYFPENNDEMHCEHCKTKYKIIGDSDGVYCGTIIIEKIKGDDND